MVLAFLIVFSTIIAALLGIIVTTNRATITYRQDRALRFAADAALEVALVNVQHDFDLGDTETDEPCGQLPIGTTSTTTGLPDPEDVFTATSTLTITCRATDLAATSAERRDVTFEVWCGRSGGGPSERVTCDPGAADQRLLAEARIRYDHDPGYGNEPGEDPAEQARVPKIVSWVLHG